MSEQHISPYVYLDKHHPDGVILYVSEAHNNDLAVTSAIAGAYNAHPGLNIKRIKLDALKVLQLKSTVINAGEGRGFSAEQEQIIALFREAKKLNSSDIHMLIGMNNVTIIQFRIHGDLQAVRQLDRDEGQTLASTVVLSMCDIAEKSFYPNRAQDGRIRKEFLDSIPLFGARYAHNPAEFGIYVVMRILPDDGKKAPTLDELGFLKEQQILIRRMLSRPEGVITLSGPTGSGKSTSLRTFSGMYLDSTEHKKRLMTLEDPPEG
ncbi:MAG: ATPase, T2SS/T4P/T4SS family, partial [Plesiomonas shigelloides]